MTKTIIVQQSPPQPQPPQPQPQQQQLQAQPQQLQAQPQQLHQQHQLVQATANTVHLPSQPVPKELLNINGQQQQVQPIHEPLNPANIPLPPSVASALQFINEKVTARQNKQKAMAEAAAARQAAAIIAAKQESALAQMNVQVCFCEFGWKVFGQSFDL
jgi:hypothetical protein